MRYKQKCEIFNRKDIFQMFLFNKLILQTQVLLKSPKISAVLISVATCKDSKVAAQVTIFKGG